MPRKAVQEEDSKDSSSKGAGFKEEDFHLMESDIEEVLRNIGSQKGEDLTVVTEETRKEEVGGEVDPVRKEDKMASRREEEEPLERLVKKVNEVYEFLDELSRGLAQLNKDLRDKVGLITTEMDRFTASLRDTSWILDRVRSEAQGTPQQMQAGVMGEREPAFAAPQQPPPPTGPQSYPPPPQQSYQSPPQQQPQYYSQRPIYPPPPRPPPPQPSGLSPEEAVARGVEMLKGTVFVDVTASLEQVASIIYSRLLDAREKILRMDPQFPMQEFEPVLSELRANPRMKLSHVDKRKLVDRMVNWANRLPRT